MSTITANKSYLEEDFTDLTQENENLNSLSLEKCNLRNCNFQKSNFEQSYFADCTFENCNLSLINVKLARFDNVRFLACKIIGVEWFKVAINLGFGVSFRDCFLDFGNFSGLVLKGVDFSNSSLK
jgi:fluoroquinolone resistance protein